jgi:asparagine synthase (glutamine-hydrolysing)
MCGICGVFHHERTAQRVDEDVLVRMRDTMVHRGPDDHGLWMSADRRMGLGFRRLAIIDLSPAAGQPMTNEDGTVWLTYNGEIYNHLPLREELRRAGHRFRTDHSDSEVIVHAYEQWGPKCLERFEGMFAIAIWDGPRRRLFLARDRIGVKPLYVAVRPGFVAFASEIKALLAHPDVRPALSRAAMYHYLSFLTTPAPLTMFEGIYKLPAGWTVTVEEGGRLSAAQYWDALPPDGRYHRELAGLSPAAQEEFCVGEIRTRLTQAVEKRMMSDVPFGVFLSGGIDSSTNVALMSRFTVRPVETFTVGFRDHTHLNELEYARQIARDFRTHHHEVLIGEREMHEYLPDLVYHQDEPIADWVCIPLYFVSKLVRDSGTIVVQVGEGSDEQFCGYRTYMGYLRLYQRYWRPFRRLPDFLQRGFAALARSGAEATGRGRLYADIVDRAAQGREHIWGGAVMFWESGKRRLLRPGRFDDVRPAVPAGFEGMLPEAFFRPDSFAVVSHYLAEFDRRFPGADVLTRMIYLEFKLRLSELLLMRVDKISMSTSIEARVPFLDHKLVEFTMGVPMGLKIKNGVTKHLLKRACAGIIPDNIIQRPKVGFGAPMKEWLRSDFGRAAEATVLGSSLRHEGFFDEEHVRTMFQRHRAGEDHSLGLWTLYNLTAWFDRWVAREAA